MKRTAYALLGALAVVGILILAAAVPSQTDFDTAYFNTNALPITMRGNLTNWAKLSTNAASSGIAGTVISTGAAAADAIPRYTTDTNVVPTSVRIPGLTNLVVPGIVSANGIIFPSDNTYDIGASGATRPKDYYGAGSVIIAGVVTSANPANNVFSGNIFAGSTKDVGWVGRSIIQSPANGHLMLSNLAENDFDRLQFGGTTASFPALQKHAANSIALVPADVSAGSMELQIGADAATTSEHTLKFADGVGTDKNGAPGVVAGGQSTGTGAGGAVILKTSQSSTTGSSANAYTERFHAVPKFVNLTESTATTILTAPVAAANYLGFTATVTIFASDGTDHQSKTSVITVDAVAKTTTITPTISQVDNTTAASAGTLTCTYTAVDNTSNVLALKADAVSSLTQTTLRAKIVVTAINSNGTAALTEQ